MCNVQGATIGDLLSTASIYNIKNKIFKSFKHYQHRNNRYYSILHQTTELIENFNYQKILMASSIPEYVSDDEVEMKDEADCPTQLKSKTKPQVDNGGKVPSTTKKQH
ncbi:hypothetical protein BpHYR1_032024 [Brachionus plicatilis]|uniref:Uncharacterized protein n=1 Tax=Brachionus plicatilis TaxID=10195 RepID=A0A3M7T1T8_BRAPC|nr:hypothetical protein BpHYR1_032024 [Brachionus plicatilis]